MISCTYGQASHLDIYVSDSIHMYTYIMYISHNGTYHLLKRAIKSRAPEWV